jgi:putative PIN family toxin of toxin-antitoxin system
VRVVLDTDVLIAAFVARGQCHELLEHAARAHHLLTSEAILAELRDKLAGKLGASAETVQRTLDLLRSRMTVVAISPLPAPICRDPDDDSILATALAARADCLITGAADLLVLDRYDAIPIVRPADFWALEARGREG